jgi:hypothetical protein
MSHLHIVTTAAQELDADTVEAMGLDSTGRGIVVPRCKLHPAFEADYCPTCGTSQVIGANGRTR